MRGRPAGAIAACRRHQEERSLGSRVPEKTTTSSAALGVTAARSNAVVFDRVSLAFDDRRAARLQFPGAERQHADPVRRERSRQVGDPQTGAQFLRPDTGTIDGQRVDQISGDSRRCAPHIA
jgi:hypothetical protein